MELRTILRAAAIIVGFFWSYVTLIGWYVYFRIGYSISGSISGLISIQMIEVFILLLIMTVLDLILISVGITASGGDITFEDQSKIYEINSVVANNKPLSPKKATK